MFALVQVENDPPVCILAETCSSVHMCIPCVHGFVVSVIDCTYVSVRKHLDVSAGECMFLNLPCGNAH